MLDSTFNQDQQRAKTILKQIDTIAPQIHFHFEVRSEFIDREMARLFAKINCSLQIGLQSADPLVMKGVGRNFNRNDFVAKAGLLNRAGTVFGFDLIYGLPGDDFTGFAASIDFALGLYPNHLDIFPLAILPGTALATRAGSIGLNYHHAPPYTLIESPSFSKENMAQARRLATACDMFYTRGKAVAWFNSIAASLSLRPSELLNQFSRWLAATQDSDIKEDVLSDEEIWKFQRNFLTTAYTGRLQRLLPLALDLVDYHHHYAAALLTPPPRLPEGRILKGRRMLDVRAQLSPSTKLARFHYDIIEILEAGEPDLRNFTKQHVPRPSWAAIYPTTQGVFTESLAEAHYRFLVQMDGVTPCSTISARLHIPTEEAREFVEFALNEGMITLSVA